MSKFNPRALMEEAVNVMKGSVVERRSDGKATPFVGAVLWKPDGNSQSACRGELRDGDHAEYTLIERKNHSSKLEEGVLFATLEPCAPGARRQPKLSCSERIVHARIKEVWIGIEDPDPTVDRKGIKYLQESGVEVHMFDRDLQEEIKKANRAFIDQALERAAADGEREPTTVTLSPLETMLPRTTYQDLSQKALEQYRKIVGTEELADPSAFHQRLLRQGLLEEDPNGRETPTGFGYLLFGQTPRTALPQAGMLATIHFADGREELRNFDGPQVLVPEQVLEWLRNKLPSPIERSAARRRESNEALFELVREGVVNALVHRDYAISGAKCQLIVTEETVSVKSPGQPVEPITVQQMQTFDAPMLSRNPVLHYVFASMELAEERGLGLKSMKLRAQSAGLPLPRYSLQDPYLVLTIYRSTRAAVRTLSTEILNRLNDDEKASWEFIVGRDSVTSSMLMEHLDFDERKAQRILKKLREVGLIRRVGRGPATRYEILQS